MKKASLLLLVLGAFILHSGSTLSLTISNPSNTSFRPGKDFALFFAVNDYDHWDDLANPVSDVEAIAKDLKDLYGFETEVVRNPDRKTILDKIEAYRKKTYAKDAQLLIFFSGHGEFNEDSKQGYFVPKNGQKNDTYGDSYIEYEGLKRRISSLPCEHILLALDACYSGTADESIAMRGEPGKRPGAGADAERERYIAGALQYRSRIMLTSGAKLRTPDKSQFAAKFLEALRARGGQDGLLNTPELLGYLTTALPKPVATQFGDHAPGGEFLFVLEGAPNAAEPKSSVTPKTEDKTAADIAAWKKAGQLNLKSAYRDYQKNFCPGGAYCDVAEIRIAKFLEDDKKAWDAAKAINSFSSYDKYMKDFVEGEYRKQADIAKTTLLDEQSWESANKKNTIEGFNQYRYEFPQGRHNAEALLQIQILESLKTADDGLVFVKGGEFLMGCPEGTQDCISDKPRKVKVDDFYIGKYEVTQKLWEDVMGENYAYNRTCALCPIEQITREKVNTFIKKLNAKSGRKYRLPTEAEWEYAAREGGKSVLFGNGKNVANPKEINFDWWQHPAKPYSLRSPSQEDDWDKTTPVGYYPANSLGLFDMSGNVKELCDGVVKVYIKELKFKTWYYPGRGGSWEEGPIECIAMRQGSWEEQNMNSGFRLARSK